MTAPTMDAGEVKTFFCRPHQAKLPSFIAPSPPPHSITRVVYIDVRHIGEHFLNGRECSLGCRRGFEKEIEEGKATSFVASWVKAM